MLQHYVFLKYRDGTTDAHVAGFCERMLALRGTIGEIERLEIGRDELHDARSWDLVMTMEFASVEALRAYQRHPDHQKLKILKQRFGWISLWIALTSQIPNMGNFYH